MKSQSLPDNILFCSFRLWILWNAGICFIFMPTASERSKLVCVSHPELNLSAQLKVTISFQVLSHTLTATQTHTQTHTFIMRLAGREPQWFVPLLIAHYHLSGWNDLLTLKVWVTERVLVDEWQWMRKWTVEESKTVNREILSDCVKVTRFRKSFN